jgi:hypothetical protein
VLQEIELLVGRGLPEVLPLVGERVAVFLASSLVMVMLLFLPKGGLAST